MAKLEKVQALLADVERYCREQRMTPDPEGWVNVLFPAWGATAYPTVTYAQILRWAGPTIGRKAQPSMWRVNLPALRDAVEAQEAARPLTGEEARMAYFRAHGMV